MNWFTQLYHKGTLRLTKRLFRHYSPLVAGFLNRIGRRYGIPEPVLRPLSEYLKRHPSETVRMDQEAITFAHRYSALLEHLEQEDFDRHTDGKIRCAVRAGDFDRAAELLQHAIEENLSDPEQQASRYYLRAALHELQFRLRQALDDYAEAHRLAPANPAYALAHAVAVQDDGRLEEACDIYRATLSATRGPGGEIIEAYLPYAAAALDRLGTLQAHLQQFGDATDSFRKALALRRRLAKADPGHYLPGLAMTLDNLGRLRRNAGRLREAEQAFRKALTLRLRLAEASPELSLPDVAKSYTGLGLLYADTGRLRDGEDLLREALSLYRQLNEEGSADYRPDQVAILTHLEALYADGGRDRDADAIRTELQTLTRPPPNVSDLRNRKRGRRRLGS